MKVKNLASVLLSIITLSITPAAMSQDAENASDPGPTKVAVNNGKQTASQTAPVEKIGLAILKLPIAATSLVTGAVAGTPIAMVRESASELSSVSKQSWEGFHDPFKAPMMLFLTTPAVMASVMSGVLIAGPTCGIQNSLVNSWKKPFSKEAFSLGSMSEWNQF